jgi:hypothetical protein
MNRFKKRKKPSKRKLIILLVVLLGILYFWMNAERILGSFMGY